LKFKPGLWEENEHTTKIREDLILILNGFEPVNINKNIMHLTGFLKNSKLSVKIASIVYEYVFTPSLPPGLSTLLQIEWNSSVLGWKIQETVANHIHSIIKNRSLFNTTINYLAGGIDKKQDTFLEINKIEHLDYSLLHVQTELKPNILYFDMGSPSKDRWKQAHLPGIDAIAYTGIIDNSVKVVALQIKSAMNLNYSSIDNTIWRFLVHRKESGSVLRTFLSGCFSTYLDGTLKITMTTDRNNSIDVTQISEEALKNTLQIEKFHSLNFRLCDDQKRKIEGVVDLYILVIGSFNTNILNHYPGVRFIWGLNQLSSLMGEKSLDYLKLNTRFRIISICRMELDFDLTQYDNNYKKVTVYSKVAKRYATYS